MCENCESKGSLEVHHIEPLEKWETRHNSPKNSQDNLVVLCRSCHEVAHHGLTLARASIPKEQLPFKELADLLT